MSHVQLVCKRIYNHETDEYEIYTRWVHPVHGVMGGVQHDKRGEPRDYPFLGQGEDVRPNKEY